MNDAVTYELIEAELLAHGFYASVTKGTSMQPLFKTNRDVVILKRPDRELKRYDVVLYRSRSDAYTLHRIIGIKGDTYVIRGDNTYSKEYVAKDRIIAVLSEFNRKGKRHSVDEPLYRLYSRLWRLLYPLRYACLRLYTAAYRIFKEKKR